MNNLTWEAVEITKRIREAEGDTSGQRWVAAPGYYGLIGCKMRNMDWVPDLEDGRTWGELMIAADSDDAEVSRLIALFDTP